MSIIRAKLGGAFVNSAKNAARMATVTNELTENWLRRLNDTATTGDAKEAHS